jgi:nicotinate-nucleotide adenylyltransferase
MIALLGGSFDPVHLGHLQVARDAQQALATADFRMLPAGQPPHRDSTQATALQRLEMLRLALAEHPGIGIDRREIDRPGPSWMVDTLADLRREHPLAPLCLVLGQDAANQLDSWHQWRRLPGLAHLVVMTRAGESAGYSAKLAAELGPRQVAQVNALLDLPAGRVLPVPVTAIDISSTAVRQRIASGASLQDWLAPAVEDYIRRHGLYGARPIP